MAPASGIGLSSEDPGMGLSPGTRFRFGHRFGFGRVCGKYLLCRNAAVGREVEWLLLEIC